MAFSISLWAKVALSCKYNEEMFDIFSRMKHINREFDNTGSGPARQSGAGTKCEALRHLSRFDIKGPDVDHVTLHKLKFFCF